jgi:hypothetical protein
MPCGVEPVQPPDDLRGIVNQFLADRVVILVEMNDCGRSRIEDPVVLVRQPEFQLAGPLPGQIADFVSRRDVESGNLQEEARIFSQRFTKEP